MVVCVIVHDARVRACWDYEFHSACVRRIPMTKGEWLPVWL